MKHSWIWFPPLLLGGAVFLWRTPYQALESEAPAPARQTPVEAEPSPETLVNEALESIDMKDVDFDVREPDDFKRLQFAYDVRETTGFSNVRKINVDTQVRYHLNRRSSLGVVAGTDIPDYQDAEAWQEETTSENTAAVKYKLSF